MTGYINYREFQCMDVAEQKKSEAFIRELAEKLIETKTNGKGVLASVVDGVVLNDYCKVQAGTTNGTLKILEGWFVTKGSDLSGAPSNNIANSSILLGHLNLIDNVEITDLVSKTSGQIEYVVIKPKEVNVNGGVVSLAAASNQVTGVGVDFTELRDHSTGAPMKVRFKKMDGTSPINDQDYDIVDIASSTTAVLSGSLSDEANLKMEIIGSFDLNEQSNLTGKVLYSYIDAEINYESSISALLDYQIPIAKLIYDGAGGFTIEDIRVDNVLRFYNDRPTKTLPISKVTDYTFTLGDEDHLFQSNPIITTNPLTFTVPLNSSTPFEIGTSIHLMRLGEGSLTIQGEAGVFIRAAETLTLRSQYSAASLIKIDTDTWLLTGDLTLS